MSGHLLVSTLLSIVLINDQRESILPAYTSHDGYIAYEIVQGSSTKELFLVFLRNSAAVCCVFFAARPDRRVGVCGDCCQWVALLMPVAVGCSSSPLSISSSSLLSSSSGLGVEHHRF